MRALLKLFPGVLALPGEVCTILITQWAFAVPRALSVLSHRVLTAPVRILSSGFTDGEGDTWCGKSQGPVPVLGLFSLATQPALLTFAPQYSLLGEERKPGLGIESQTLALAL